MGVCDVFVCNVSVCMGVCDVFVCVCVCVCESESVMCVGVCVCVALISSMHSACAMLCCLLWTLRPCSAFPPYSINDTIFGEKFLNIERVFLFVLQILSETFSPFKNNPARYYHSCISVFT